MINYLPFNIMSTIVKTVKMNDFKLKQFAIITLTTSIWIHLSEIFRYSFFIMSRVKSFFNDKAGVVEMSSSISAIWILWDTLLTAILVFIFWLYAKSFGNNPKSVLISGTIVWLSVFVIFWVATANMGLSHWNILLIALPLSWVEMVVGTLIASKLYSQYQ